MSSKCVWDRPERAACPLALVGENGQKHPPPLVLMENRPVQPPLPPSTAAGYVLDREVLDSDVRAEPSDQFGCDLVQVPKLPATLPARGLGEGAAVLEPGVAPLPVLRLLAGGLRRPLRRLLLAGRFPLVALDPFLPAGARRHRVAVGERRQVLHPHVHPDWLRCRGDDLDILPGQDVGLDTDRRPDHPHHPDLVLGNAVHRERGKAFDEDGMAPAAGTDAELERVEGTDRAVQTLVERVLVRVDMGGLRRVSLDEFGHGVLVRLRDHPCPRLLGGAGLRLSREHLRHFVQEQRGALVATGPAPAGFPETNSALRTCWFVLTVT